MLARLCDIYKTCYNWICASLYLFSNANERITVAHPEDTPADKISDKVVGEFTKSVNNWLWLYTYISTA